MPSRHHHLIASAALACAAFATAVNTGPAAASAYDDAPPAYKVWIDRADAGCAHRSVTGRFIAAQLQAESNFVASARNVTGTDGPAAFSARQWVIYGVDADQNGRSSPFDIGDAVIALGREDCALARQLDARHHRSDPVDIAAARIGGIDNVDHPKVINSAARVISHL